MGDAVLHLAWPWLIAALPLPLLAALLPRAVATPAALRVPFYAVMAGSLHGDRMPRPRWRRLLAGLAWLLLVLAACRPQWLGEPVNLPRSGRDLLLAVDISGSMQAGDMALNGRPASRLEVVKRVAGDFIDRRAGDRVGLILFGRQAYLQAPLTFDRATVGTLLEESAIGLAGKETAIGDAIGLAVKKLRHRPQEQRVLVLLTDGANTAGALEPLRAAELAAQAGVRVYAIGVGADQMRVEDFFGLRRANPAADLDEKTLTAIAARTDGGYFRARDAQGLEDIYRLLDELEPVVQDDQVFRPVRDLYWWPLAAAFGIAVLLVFMTRHDR
ncbi:MAG: VWA domain-containing protein [Pseudomonadota bacterium]|nr:VWA domain-containing protein [Pseudomonadota bacterium]